MNEHTEQAKRIRRSAIATRLLLAALIVFVVGYGAAALVWMVC